MRNCILLLVLVFAFLPLLNAQQAPENSLPANIAPDLDVRLSKWVTLKMPFDESSLSPREIMLVRKLVQASQYLEDIYWRQSDPQGLELYKSLAGDPSPEAQKIRRLLTINGSRFDLVAENSPFVQATSFSPYRGLYPEGLTREQIEAYVRRHPDKKDELYSSYTVIQRKGDELVGVPYTVVYHDLLEKIANSLREAAIYSDDPQFAQFLRLRADAMLTDDFYKSDIAWLDLKSPKFDVIFAPYETYLDDVLGVKTSYGAAVLIRNEKESAKLAIYQKYIPQLQQALPIADADKPSKAGHVTPMEVMDAPFRAGDLRHGYQPVADNLPNDARIHQEKGTKKIFFKNFMDARVNYIILPVAKLLMDPAQAAKASGEGYLASTLMHEISHGIGPAFARTPSGQKDIREAIGPIFGGLEEAKADVTGMFGLQWLMDKGVLPKTRAQEYYASYVAGIFRTVRFGVAEAHGKAEMMEFNFLSERGAITRMSNGRYRIDYAKIPAALAALTKELLEIEATGDRARAEAWFAKYDKMPQELSVALERTSKIPVDIDPVYSFTEPVQ